MANDAIQQILQNAIKTQQAIQVQGVENARQWSDLARAETRRIAIDGGMSPDAFDSIMPPEIPKEEGEQTA